jgi:hypothetical protein
MALATFNFTDYLAAVSTDFAGKGGDGARSGGQPRARWAARQRGMAQH